MTYGTVGTGVGAPVGGATTNFGNTAAAQPAQGGTGLFDFGSTLNSNLVLSGVGHILQGAGELLQSAAQGNTAGLAPAPTLDAGQPQPNVAGGGLDPLMQSLGSGQLDAIIGQLNALVNQLSALTQQAPAPAVPQQQPQQPQLQPQQRQQPQVQPQVDPVANLVNRANVDPALKPAVTQIANDPVGNALLTGAVNDGLAGIQVADLGPGFFGQALPATRQIQIDPATIQGPDLIRTVAHELVHGATFGNGNSLAEEQTADKIGTEIQQRITGFGPGYVLGGEAYNGLPQDNGIAQALRMIGITV